MVVRLLVVLVDALRKDHERVPHKEMRNVLRKQPVDALGQQPVAYLFVDLEIHVIVFAVHARVQIRVHRVVPALAQPPRTRARVVRRLVGLAGRFAPLCIRPVVHRARDDVPTAVDVGEVAAVYWGRCRGCQEQRRDGDELVVELARLVDRVRLHRDLQTATPHPEAHRIHVDVVGQRGTELRLGVLGEEVALVRDRRVDERLRRVCVAVDGHIDAHLGAAALADVGRERREAHMGINEVVREEQRAARWPLRLERRVGERRIAHAEAGERRDRHRDLVLLQVPARDRASRAHVFLDAQQVARHVAERRARRAFDHVAAVLWVERRPVRACTLLRALLQHVEDLALA